jgi:hypothetical protein
MSIAAADTAPAFHLRRKLAAEDLRHLADPCVIFEHEWFDSDGERCFAYTVGGMLDGQPLGDFRGGCTVGGEVIIVHADDRGAADAMASLGLMDTINALDSAEAAHLDALAAKARLEAVGPVRRMELATAKPADTSDQFVADAAAIRPLRGDDIVLTVGGADAPPA